MTLLYTKNSISDFYSPTLFIIEPLDGFVLVFLGVDNMYVPIFKNRQQEMNVISTLNHCFFEQIIPLVEVIDDIYLKRYAVDHNGDFILELKEGNKKMTKVLLPLTQDDVITEKELCSLFKNKLVFIDYFRFKTDEYGKNVKYDKVILSRMISSDVELYLETLRRINKIQNFIPVISLKSGFDFSNSELNNIILEFQEIKESIAIRITSDLLEEHIDLLCGLLRDSDYLLFDIKNNKLRSQVMQLELFEEFEFKCNKILLNSPRESKMNNGDFEDCKKTNFIDNSVVVNYKDYNFKGFGDYCGCKDILPTTTRNKGKGAALAILYNAPDNSFYSFVNYNTDDGVRGYKNVVEKIILMGKNFDNYYECPAFKKIISMKKEDKYGTWSTWNNITMTRYLHQIYINKKYE